MACNHNCDDCKDKAAHQAKSMLKPANKYSSVKKIIAVMSGKGGVGKSMVTALLASELHKKGYNTGVLDADITGPSIPKMFGIHEKAMGSQEGLIPSESKGGVKVMSSNLLLENETDPVVWRGSLIANLTTQFWTEVMWTDIDYLFVDMPPGTGDVPLTVFQSIGVDGIIVVTSPQELVGMIVEKACKMANMMNIPVIGLIENMSYIECPDCKKHINVFGESKVDALAQKYNLTALAKMPIDPNLASLADKGDIEKANPTYLEDCLNTLENLPVKVDTVIVPVKGDKVSNDMTDFDKAYAYQIVRDMVIGMQPVEINTVDQLNDLIDATNAKAILVNKIDDELCKSYEDALIDVIVECKDDPLENVKKYLAMGDDCDYVKQQSCSHDCSTCQSKCSGK